MKWRYGVIKSTTTHHSQETVSYHIGEVYYNTDPNTPTMCSDIGYFPSLEDEGKTEKEVIEDFKLEIQRILQDIEDNKIIDANGPFDTWGKAKKAKLKV